MPGVSEVCEVGVAVMTIPEGDDVITGESVGVETGEGKGWPLGEGVEGASGDTVGLVYKEGAMVGCFVTTDPGVSEVCAVGATVTAGNEDGDPVATGAGVGVVRGTLCGGA